MTHNERLKNARTKLAEIDSQIAANRATTEAHDQSISVRAWRAAGGDEVHTSTSRQEDVRKIGEAAAEMKLLELTRTATVAALDAIKVDAACERCAESEAKLGALGKNAQSKLGELFAGYNSLLDLLWTFNRAVGEWELEHSSTFRPAAIEAGEEWREPIAAAQFPFVLHEVRATLEQIRFPVGGSTFTIGELNPSGFTRE